MKTYTEKEVKEIAKEVADMVQEPLERENRELELQIMAIKYGWKDIKWVNHVTN